MSTKFFFINIEKGYYVAINIQFLHYRYHLNIYIQKNNKKIARLVVSLKYFVKCNFVFGPPPLFQEFEKMQSQKQSFLVKSKIALSYLTCDPQPIHFCQF